MKRLMIFAICAMAVMISCKNKGKTEAASLEDTISAVIDSIIEETDTTPMPMFLMGEDGRYAQMLYWTSDLKEPQKTEDNEDWFAIQHQSWALQDMFRRNIHEYTNMFVDGKVVKIKFVDEVLKDPDGNTPSVGERHGRPEIPSLCARFDFADAKDKKNGWGDVIVTDNYLKSRKHLPITFIASEWNKPKPLPSAVIKQLEQKYGMKVSRMQHTATIGDHYIWGCLQFEGAYANAPKDKYDPDRRSALALDVIIDGDKFYVHEELGYYDDNYGATWNADDDGQYVGCDLLAAFEGPKGLELCYRRDAPESTAIGMFYMRGDQLVQITYETYHNMVDEQRPIWKSDIAQMQKLFQAADHEYRNVKLTKWAYTYVDFTNDWLWLRDKKDEYGAFFIRDDAGNFHFVAAETPRLKPTRLRKDGICYLCISGSAGGPATYSEIYAFKDGKQIERFTALYVYGDIDECTLNGKPLSKEDGQTYVNNLPDPEEMTASFTDIEAKTEP